MAARATVTVYAGSTGSAAGTTAMPGVFSAPIRRDIVHFVHSNIAKNSRQAYAVSEEAGHQTSAESWGTGRAVARIPRVGGGGTGRSGQGAFGNMCRKGRMFAPTKIWRRWHRHVNVNQRRYALVSALAASAVPALVMARGHKVDKLPELPLVVSGIENVKKTKEAVEVLNKLGAAADIDRVKDTKKVRAGAGKGRGRKYVSRRGPLVVYGPASAGIVKAFRNLPGVDLAHVDRLNLLQLAPGGHMGRFCIWTADAFARLGAIYGSATAKAAINHFVMPRAMMANADLARLINSAEVQGKVKPAIKDRRFALQKKNPLKNKKAMDKLNPYAAAVRKAEAAAADARAKARASGVAKKRDNTRSNLKKRNASKATFKALTSDEFKRPAEFL